MVWFCASPRAGIILGPLQKHTYAKANSGFLEKLAISCCLEQAFGIDRMLAFSKSQKCFVSYVIYTTLVKSRFLDNSKAGLTLTSLLYTMSSNGTLVEVSNRVLPCGLSIKHDIR